MNWPRITHRVTDVYFDHFQKSGRLIQRSAFRPQADIFGPVAEVRKVPNAEVEPRPPTPQMRSPSRLNSLASFAGTPNCLGVATTCASLIFKQRLSIR